RPACVVAAVVGLPRASPPAVSFHAGRRSRCDLAVQPRRPKAREARRFPGLFVFMPDLLPVFLNVAGRRVVLVGGGRVAAAKLPSLVATGARVTVVAPEVREEIARSPVDVVHRTFEPSHLDGAWLVVAAATPNVNADV